MKPSHRLSLLVCTLSLANSVAAYAGNDAYLFDQWGAVSRNSYNECWRTAEWTPEKALPECGAPAKAAAKPAAPAPAPVAAVVPVAPAPIKIELSADGSFQSGQATLLPEAKAKLDKLAGDLHGITYDKLSITGHADRTGKKASNQQLSERRANAVHNYLVSQGVPAAKMSANGVGSSQPVTQMNDCNKLIGKKLAACLAPDRRVEVRVNGIRAK
ncbi:MAG: OmpA family protein [Gallionella sp.]|nr:OmpA family protein [Gallionella sp.]